MGNKKSGFISSFGQTQKTNCFLYRPERQSNIEEIIEHPPLNRGLLARGKGLSYGDVCLNNTLVSTEQLDRVALFDKSNHTMVVEPGIKFSELMSMSNDHIPPVIPGTVHASIGGAVANDVHGKNHWHQSAFGHHINWLEIALPEGIVKASRDKHSDLFYASIGGLGLTGFIKKISFNMRKNSRCVSTKNQCFPQLLEGISLLVDSAKQNDYAACWADLYQEGRGVLISANHILAMPSPLINQRLSIPFTPPLSLIRKSNIQYVNQLYFKKAKEQKKAIKQNLEIFNNPLDKVKHFNRLYGRKGFYQLQCVVPFEFAKDFANHLLLLVKSNEIQPSLCVIKVLNKAGLGMLSFTQPGITFAIDFPFSHAHKKAINSLQSLLVELKGRVYLAKDSLLCQSTFRIMYPNYENFIEVLQDYGAYDIFQSSMSRRLGIHA